MAAGEGAGGTKTYQEEVNVGGLEKLKILCLLDQRLVVTLGTPVARCDLGRDENLGSRHPGVFDRSANLILSLIAQSRVDPSACTVHSVRGLLVRTCGVMLQYSVLVSQTTNPGYADLPPTFNQLRTALYVTFGQLQQAGSDGLLLAYDPVPSPTCGM